MNWRTWLFENVYLPICFVITVAGFVAVALNYLSFWPVVASSICVWILNSLIKQASPHE